MLFQEKQHERQSNRVLRVPYCLLTGHVGIGAAIARNLAAKGCSLVLNYTSDSSEKITQELAEELQSQHGIKAVPVQANMGDENGPKVRCLGAK